MIKFNADNKLIWKRMIPENVPIFIHFLNVEIARHMVERDICDRKVIQALHDKNQFLADLWMSAKTRHIKDVKDTEKLVRKLKSILR